jgi:hypothetical protein
MIDENQVAQHDRPGPLCQIKIPYSRVDRVEDITGNIQNEVIKRKALDAELLYEYDWRV